MLLAANPITRPFSRALSNAPAELVACRQDDPAGTRAHVWCVAAMCLLISWPTSVVEFAGAGAIVAMLVRARHTVRTVPGALLRAPVPIALAIAAWLAVTLAWSADPGRGVEEVAAWRWLWIPIVVWPVIHARHVLVSALAWGFVAGIATQWLHVAGVHAWDRDPARVSGWWDPVVGGSVLCAALGLHLGLMASRRGAWRIAHAVAAVAVAVSIGLTGTRGAMLGAALLVAIAAAVAVGRARRRPRVLAAVVPGCLALGAGGVAVVSLHGDALADRVGDAQAEVSAVLDGAPPRGDTALRVRMAEWALAGWAESPLVGRGAGAFRAYSSAALTDEGEDPATYDLHDHAHSALPHALFVSGVVGAALLAALVWSAVSIGVRRREPAAALGIAGLACAGLFDTIQINAQTVALLCLLIALLPPRVDRASS